MGLFDFFKPSSAKFSTDRILTPRQIEEVLDEDYGDSSDAVIFIAEQSKPILPTDMFLMPFLNAQFSKDEHLAMIYGTGSGCALVRKTALQKAQTLHRTGKNIILCCSDFIYVLQKLGYTVRKDPKLDLNLL